jgi:putative heme-binding domain-containing protein
LSEPHLPGSSQLLDAVLSLVDDADPHVRYQTVLSLGDTHHPRVWTALAQVAARQSDDRWTRAAILSCLGTPESADAFLLELVRCRFSQDGVLLLAAELGRLTAIRTAKEPATTLANHSAVIARNSTGPQFHIAYLGGFAEVDPDSVRTLLERPASTESSRLPAARKMAVDKALALAQRQQAIRLLAFDSSPATESSLRQLLGISEPVEIQTAALRSLLAVGHPSVAAELLAPPAWDLLSPTLRQSLIQIAANRGDLVGLLLDAIEGGTVSSGLLVATQKEALRRLKDQTLRSRAERLVTAVPSDRQKAYDSAKAALALRPTPGHGRDVFERACAACHRLNQQGIAVGPDLFGIRQQPKESILYHIIIPEAEIAPNFVNYECELKDGRSFSGLLAAESAATITLRMAQGLEEVLPRHRVERLTASRLSLMPQEMEKTLSLQEIADLLAYLRGEP